MNNAIRHIDQLWFRAIPSRFPTADVYARLGPIALRTAARQIGKATSLTVPSNERAAEGACSDPATVRRIPVPVVARNPEGTYLLGPNHAVLEVAANPPAALALAVWRRETFLSRTKEKARDLDMRLVQARIKGDFVDLTSMSPDMTRDQRWALGSELYTEGTHGAIFTRPDFPGASFLAVFDGSVLQPDVPGAHYRFAWDGAVVRSIYDYNRNAEIGRLALLAAGCR